MHPPVKLAMKDVSKIGLAAVKMRRKDVDRTKEQRDWRSMCEVIIKLIESTASETHRLGERITGDPILEDHVGGLHAQVS